MPARPELAGRGAAALSGRAEDLLTGRAADFLSGRAAVLLGGALVLTGAWLLVPRERGSSATARPPVRVCLVDVSASAVQRRSGWRAFVEAKLAEERELARRAGEEVETVLYGSEVRRTSGPVGAVALERETRLSGAVEVARGLAVDASESARPHGRVVVIGDRTYTGEDPARRVRELLDLGVAFEWVDLPPPDREELSFGPVVLPRELEVGAPIALEVPVFCAPGPRKRTTWTATIVHASAAGRDEREIHLAVPPGLSADPDGYVRWRLRETAGIAASGWNRIRLKADGGSGDPVEGIVRCGGRLVVGVVSSALVLATPSSPPPSSPEGLDLETIAPADLASELPSLDAAVTDAGGVVPAPVLRSFVERGGGWLRAGSASLGGSAEEVDLEPLRPADDDRDPRDVVVLVDRSGSMSGAPFENVRRAVLRLVEVAPAKDRVELRFFGDRLSDPVLLKASMDGRARDRILREASERFFGGGTGGSTAVARSLEAFAEAREQARRDALVFLLTDGKDTVDADAAARCSRVLPRLLAARTRLVVIAASEDPDRNLLDRLVATGESLRAVGELSSSSRSLAEIFERELSKDRFREGEDLRVLPAPAAEGSLAADLLRAEPDPAAWPRLQRYARAKLAPGAEAILVSDRGEPLLAIHRVGSGMVAAAAFDPGPEWSPLLAPLLRMLARGTKDTGARARIDEGGLTVEGLPQGAPAELEARVFLAGEDAPALVLALSPPIEGSDPARTRTAAARAQDLVGAERVEVRPPGRVDGSWPPLELWLAAPRAPEFALPRPRVDDALAAESARPPKEREAAGPRSHPAAPWVLFSGLLLLTISGLAGSFARRSR